jgi:hypothetical protein
MGIGENLTTDRARIWVFSLISFQRRLLHTQVNTEGEEMKRTGFFLALVLLTIGPVTFAQKDAAPSGSISVAKILEGYLAATGGLESHRSLNSLKATGDFGVSTGSPLRHLLGDYMFLYKAPAKDVLEVQMISHGTNWTGHRDNQPIHRSTVASAKMINGAGMEIVEQCMASLLEWDVHDYSKVELIGKAQVQNRLALALRFTPKKGDPQVRYYDTENFLMLRMDQVQRLRQAKGLPEAVYAISSYFEDYRQFGTVKLPQRIVVNRFQVDLVFELGSVKANVEIPESEFRD